MLVRNLSYRRLKIDRVNSVRWAETKLSVHVGLSDKVSDVQYTTLFLTELN
jgi:hypothetical protein